MSDYQTARVSLWCARCGRFVTYTGQVVHHRGGPPWVRVTPAMTLDQHRATAHGDVR